MGTPPESPVTSTPRIEPPHDEPRERDPRFSVMATAAGTSAIVSLLTLWLWSPATPPHDTGGSVSVTYEMLDQEHAQDGRTDEAVKQTPVADVTSTRGESSAVSTSPPARTALEQSSEDAARHTPDATELGNAPAISRIKITTQPEGASVTINGVGYGTTPLDIPYLPPGSKRIRVTKAGFETEERYYSNDAGRASSLRIRLRETGDNARSGMR